MGVTFAGVTVLTWARGEQVESSLLRISERWLTWNEVTGGIYNRALMAIPADSHLLLAACHPDCSFIF